MNRYEMPNPRAAFCLAAIAMTAITLAVSVILPATMSSGNDERGAFALSRDATPMLSDVAANRLCIDVIGVRTPELVSAQARNVVPKRKQS